MSISLSIQQGAERLASGEMAVTCLAIVTKEGLVTNCMAGVLRANVLLVGRAPHATEVCNFMYCQLCLDILC